MRQRSSNSETTSEMANLLPFDGYEISPEEADVYKSKRIRSSVIAAVSLLVGGFFLLCLGIAMLIAGHDKVDWVPAVALGCMCLVPGFYASYLSYGAYKRWQGFSWESIPSYQEVE